MSSALKRLQKEFKEMQKEKSAVCDAAPKNNGSDLFHWWACIFGPQGTPYEGGLFYLDLDIPKGYPMKPPHVTFRTPILHPNIHKRSGEICVDILKDTWTPALQIRTVLESICSLLNAPNPDDPLEADIAHLYVNDREHYNVMAQDWTRRYASQPRM